MKSTTRSILVLTVGVVIGVSLAVGHGVFAEKGKVENTDSVSLPLDELRTFTEVFAKIKKEYVEPVSDKMLIENAVRGMLSGLDPHSAFLDAEGYKELQVGTTGEFGGLGIEVGMEDGFVKVISPIDDTPAQRAGVKSGDLIIRLDETPVKGLTLNEAVKIMRGKPGSEIILTIVREGEDKPLKLTLARDVIRVKSVKSKILDEGYGYVRISNFQANTGDNVLKAVKDLRKEAKAGLKGLVLDLRNNPGGVLSAAVEVSDAFLTKGLIVYTEGRDKSSRLTFNATSSDALEGEPLVVLINGGSASASEIVAGALQDHKRAIIMGSRSFGKGSVQTILPMNNDAALKLTTARYYTPSGRSIQAEGIEPDIPLERVKVAATEAPPVERIKEADLTGHLENKKAKEKERTAGDKAKAEQSLASQDYPLYEALHMLKAMQIMQARRVN
ncbi:MAG: S41 family peptidase [Pseudomonadota bacterium]